ncbi:MAG: bifunctional lysylphosphatidylglycerol flippase/synthetase MprF [Caulobacterales bacterium]|nr:bifunctional lysylphosphatidylglycerol flippase/synthetase MprF [Caulobacterales bacterium]
MLLASAATPSLPTRFVVLLVYAPAVLIEVSHFLSPLLGLSLLLIAFGLRSRLDAAWTAAVVLVPVAAVLAVFKGLAWEEATALAVLTLLLLPVRRAFWRQAALSRMEVTPGWLASMAAVMAGAALLGWWSFAHSDFGDLPWWKSLADKDLNRAIRSSAAAAILLFAIGAWRLIATAATPKVVGEDDPDFERVRTILAQAEDAEPSANLALLGDKRFLFSPTGESFLMFGVRGRSWIALGPPVGKRAERLEMFWRFRELAYAHAARVGFYGLGPDDLPDVVELGLSIQKIGELALTPLEGFSLEGRKRGNLRRAWRKAGEDGATFEVLPPGGARAVMDELKRVSDAWLATHAGGDKAFSLGGFEARYVSEGPVAVVRFEGKIQAFATLWPTAHKGAFSIDLMRYAPDGPSHIMDYLFVELLQWGKAEGYTALDFGAAPLAGLDDRALAPMMSRLGSLLFERGENFYNFQGVRKYKDKYDPLWQPRYIATPHRWAIPFLMADVGLLSSGGVAGLAKRRSA